MIETQISTPSDLSRWDTKHALEQAGYEVTFNYSVPPIVRLVVKGHIPLTHIVKALKGAGINYTSLKVKEGGVTKYYFLNVNTGRRTLKETWS
jgi:hypothetical protein